MSNSPRVLQKQLYTASATSTGGRMGTVNVQDGAEYKLTIPQGMGGPGGEGTNPEQLFAAGYAACFGSAVDHLARLKKITTGPVAITVKASIGPVEGGAFGLAVALSAKIPEMKRDEAEALVKAAHEVCPYSNATRGNIVVDVRLED
ncbi:MAG TPA: Ohr family peroxiredoxin [Kofleriaceae bacterium]|jgi:Ohr subfamily peroxiredoxin